MKKCGTYVYITSPSCFLFTLFSSLHLHGEDVGQLHQLGHEGVDGAVDEALEVALRLLLTEVQHEPVLHHFEHIRDTHGGSPTLDHVVVKQRQQIHDQVAALAQPVVALEAVALEAVEVVAIGVVFSPDCYCHLPGKSEGGGQRLGVLPENKPEVDVEKLPPLGDHDVIQMAVPYAKNVGAHTRPRTAANVGLQGIRGNADGRVGVGIVLAQVVPNGLIM